MGIANIIPGVSGGTMMVAMGLYDRLIHAITHLKKRIQGKYETFNPNFYRSGNCDCRIVKIV